MATTWLSKMYGGGSTQSASGGRYQAAYKQYQQKSNTASAARLNRAENWNRTRYNAVTGKYGTGFGSWRPMNAQEARTLSPYRTGYANQYSRTQQEWLTQQNLRRLNGINYPQMTQDEWIRRQRAAPVGYTYTPYAGWVPTPSAQTQAPAPQDYGNQYGYGGGGYDNGGSSASLPDWYQSFLNPMVWRI